MTAVRTANGLTREEAHLAGRIPHGHAWDEATQTAIPMALAVREESVRRDAEDGLDEAKVLTAFVRTREAILRFVADQLVEAEYGTEGQRAGYPLPGKMHDYYKLPGYDKKALSKQGAEKLAQFFGLKRASVLITESQCTAEFTMAIAQVRFRDRWNNEAGSGQAAATTAERTFQGQAKKYGGDFRAAFNDIVARAVKRASTQAIVFATATDEIFDATGELEQQAEATGATEDAVTPARFPAKGWGSVSGKLVAEVATPELLRIAQWCKEKAKNPKAVQPVLEAVEDELDRRREDDDQPPV